MRTILLPISVGLLCTSFTIIPSPPANSPAAVTAVSIKHEKGSATTEASLVYDQSGLEQFGLSKAAFDFAWTGYQYLLEHNQLKKQHILSICDFSQSSKKKRLYIIDLDKKELLINTWVAHGKNSGDEFARQFSNTPESLQSSLGFYVTSGTYIGKHGLSLRLNGADPGFNDQAYFRTIVIHGASYVDEARLKSGMYMGRSWGCPAVSEKESARIIQTIKNGTCLFIYHPSRNYLEKSKILNG
ncbi:MAG TPA: murein L,D-transpeptidase catalytic domain family protein [Chitinophagaceae bacterium]|nr:murein L,D-transpeptidase catalytic domain family protein [Chitinophagaceae bacterium]